jgi:5'-nucleotidase
MNILLSNDDGVFADGIRALAIALQEGNSLGISAPDRERSAASRSMTLYAPLRARPVVLPGLENVKAYAVTGTPVDCVRLGVGNLFDRPDIVVSGVNHGGNLGTDALYSGTVAAAHEAALLGIPAVAVSCYSHSPKHLDSAALFGRRAVSYVLAHPLPFGTLMNVNVPDLPAEQVRGIKIAPLCVQQYGCTYVQRDDPSGVPYYWAPRNCLTDTNALDVDMRWIQEGYAVFTPVTYDLTDWQSMKMLNEADFS